MALPDDSTLPPESLSLSTSLPGLGPVAALVLLWSREEPGRAGEVLLFSRHEGASWTFGRDGGAGGEARPVHLVRQRPGANEPTGPVRSPRISRSQVRFRVERGGALVAENLGRCPMVHEGDEVATAELCPGDVLELRHEMMFLCAERPLGLPAPEGAPIHPFGRPDTLGFTGESPEMWDLRRTIRAVARRPVHVLVQGDSGTGKELVARAIHACSPRAARAFVARNAATFPESLLDAELFGHAKGFPNPGSPERGGLVGEADGGTLFLDEIGELPENLQAHLLRVLDSGEYHRLGEARARRADLRLVGATNRPESALKHDILARLSARIPVPGLDARREDVPLLVHHLLRRQAEAEPALAERIFPDGDLGAAPRVAPELVRALVKHGYTKNLRELDALLLVSTLEGRGRYAGLTEGVRRMLAESAGAPAVPRAPAPPVGARGAGASPSPAGARAAGALPVPAGAWAAGSSPVPAFTEEEARRLAFQRAHGFRAAACARDPGYGVNRQSADFHLRHLMARALWMSGYRVAAAEELLAGADPLLRERIHERMAKFIQNLRERLSEVGREALARSLADEWRGAAPVALDLLSAVEADAVR